MTKPIKHTWNKFIQKKYWKKAFATQNTNEPQKHPKIVQTIQDAKHKLKQERNIWKRWLPDTRPWYMIIGPNRSGKTSLLLAANYQPVSNSSKTPKTLSHTTDINIWQHKDHIMIDVTGDIFSDDSTQMDTLWQTLKSSRAPNGIDSIIITLDVARLCSSTAEFNDLMNQLNDFIHLAKKNKTDCPIHLFITQCDLIPGYSLFYDQQQEQETNPLITTIFQDTQLNTLQAFYNGFSDKQTNIHAKTLEKFSQNDTNINEINFCLHFEKLGQRLTQVIKKLPWCKKIHLAGIYLTSTQENHDHIINLSSGLLPLADRNVLSQRKIRQEAYFVEQSIQQLNNNSAQVCKKNWWRTFSPFVSAITILLIITSTGFLSHEKYKRHATWQQHITMNLLAKKNTSTLHRLKKIYSSEKYLRDQFNQDKKGELAFIKNPLYRSLEATKRSILSQQFQIELDHMVTQKLYSSLKTSSDILYDTLKTYLMLHGVGPYSPTFLTSWFIRHKSIAQQRAIETYSKSLNDLFNQGFKPIYTKNDPLIAQARDALEKQPATSIAYSILTNTITKDGINLSPIVKQSSLLNLHITQVPAIYMINNFSHMYNNVIPNIMLLIKSKDWVLNQNIGQEIPSKEKANFINRIRQLYLSHYSETWQNVLNNINFTKTTQLKDIQSQLNLLTNNKSILWQAIAIVSQNTDNNNPNSVFHKIISNPFTGLSKINPNDMQTSNAFQQQISNLNTLIKKLINSPSAPEISFILAKNHADGLSNNDPLSQIKTFANEQPLAVKQWLTRIEENIWQSLLNKTAIYINQSWHKRIYSNWHRKTQQHYPFDKQSSSDISLNNFDRLLAENGALDSFYNNTIKPFINDQKTYWQAKIIDRGSLPITQKALDFFIRTDIIRKAFYNLNPTHAGAAMIVSLAGSAPNNVWAELQFNKRRYKFNKLKKTIALTWPATNQDMATLNIFKHRARLNKITGEGPWSILRLIDHGTLSTKHPPNHFMLSLGDHRAMVNLSIRFRENSNPLIPGLLSEFALPKTLSQ